ncbi:DUF2934 domain-containing protein [Mesorhizobium sp. M4B.F.Ca.ET.017.02.2.1]|uniref:DUF2934 domain-containing protein n=1 Tax=Mesorhizobium TaxID=68287 RepID=UPI000FCA9AB8|nr:DUF2934 domain-containing protein [Mesorhizobium sp. M4B.F.Ca.ET.017.02.2.1]RVD25456.1 DUF2934 domain-containing protein [Mesorhizobium sp. M4B.F.Ca.ET.017.02.2.1]
MTDDRQERIRQRAHAIWEKAGRPEGADIQHWDQATAEIDGEAKPKKKAAPKKPAAAKPAKTAATKTVATKSATKAAKPAAIKSKAGKA